MKKSLLILACLLVFSAKTEAQQLAFGTLSAADEMVCTGTAGNQPIGQSVAVNLDVRGTYTGTITFYGYSSQSLTANTVEVFNVSTNSGSTTTTSTGTFALTNTGFTRVCAQMTAYTSGVAAVNIYRGYGSGGGGGGGGASGDVNVTEIAGNAIGTANLPVDCVVGCAAATSDADDGSIATGQTNSNANSLGMAYDGSVWRRVTFGTAGTASTQVTTIQGIAAMTPVLTTLSGTNNIATVTTVTGITNTVNTIGTIANDANAAATNRIPTLPGITENAAPTRTDGRNAALSLTTGGAARMMITNSAGAPTPIATDSTADAAAATTGPQVMGLGKNTTLPTAVTDGDSVRLLTDLAGRLRPKNVCSDPEMVSSVVISTATAGNVELVAVSGTTVPVVCGFNVIAGGTVGVQFIVGTGTACGTNELNKTGVYPLIVNSGLNSGFGAPIFKGAAGDAVCVELSTTVQIDGVLTYVSVSVP